MPICMHGQKNDYERLDYSSVETGLETFPSYETPLRPLISHLAIYLYCLPYGKMLYNCGTSYIHVNYCTFYGIACLGSTNTRFQKGHIR